MMISASWSDAPPGTGRVRVITYYSTNGGASYNETTGGDYDQIPPSSPFTFEVEAQPELSPGDLVIYRILFLTHPTTSTLGEGTVSPVFTHA